MWLKIRQVKIFTDKFFYSLDKSTRSFSLHDEAKDSAVWIFIGDDDACVLMKVASFLVGQLTLLISPSPVQVILSNDQKQMILNTVSNFEAFKRCRKRMGLDDAITYGAGMVMLFHGAPGTGKTMMANALANKLNKKVQRLIL